MPWDMGDYPSSLKYLDNIVRKKAIEIGNAMINEGYEEDRAIPIATEQAKAWYENADEDEIRRFQDKNDPTVIDNGERQYESRPEMLDKGEHVVPHEDGWAVQSKDAKQPSNVLTTKDEAVDRGKEIAKNKGTGVTIHRKDGTIEDRITYDR